MSKVLKLGLYAIVLSTGVLGCVSSVPSVSENLPMAISQSDFPAVVSAQSLADYTDTNDDPKTIVRNSVSQQALDLRVVNNKWIFRQALGRGPVLVTHPRSPDQPSIYRVKTGGAPLRYQVRAHSEGDGSTLQFWANNQLIATKKVAPGEWIAGTLSLPSGNGDVEIRHIATGWNMEYLYWSELGPDGR